MHLGFLRKFSKMLKVLFTVVNFNNLHFFQGYINRSASIVDIEQINSICFEKRFLICTRQQFKLLVRGHSKTTLT